MSATGMGTVTYNDGKRVLAFGHPFFNLGPLDMPMAKSEILMVLSSAFQPTKFGNATEVVGALQQDRFSGIMGELGAEAPSIPVHLKRALARPEQRRRQREGLEFQRLRPPEVDAVPDDADAVQFAAADERIRRRDDLSHERQRGDGRTPNIHVSTMLAPSEMPGPAAHGAGRMVGRQIQSPVPESGGDAETEERGCHRRPAAGAPRRHHRKRLDASTEVEAGTEIPVKVFLRPYRGERIERSCRVKIPAGMPKGEHRILFSDADTLNRMQHAAALGNRYMDIPETVSLLNQERGNNQLYVSLVEGRPTYYADDKTLPALPASVLNVLQTERTASRALVGSPESAQRAARHPVRPGGQRQLFAENHRKVSSNFMNISRVFCGAFCARLRHALRRRNQDLAAEPRWPISKRAA